MQEVRPRLFSELTHIVIVGVMSLALPLAGIALSICSI
jgi:hypothetical protein